MADNISFRYIKINHCLPPTASALFATSEYKLMKTQHNSALVVKHTSRNTPPPLQSASRLLEYTNLTTVHMVIKAIPPMTKVTIFVYTERRTTQRLAHPKTDKPPRFTCGIVNCGLSQVSFPIKRPRALAAPPDPRHNTIVTGRG